MLFRKRRHYATSQNQDNLIYGINSLIQKTAPQTSSSITTDSPNFTGIPKSITAGAGTNTTQIATCEFVSTAIKPIYTYPSTNWFFLSYNSVYTITHNLGITLANPPTFRVLFSPQATHNPPTFGTDAIMDITNQGLVYGAGNDIGYIIKHSSSNQFKFITGREIHTNTQDAPKEPV